jgi:predicted permease
MSWTDDVLQDGRLAVRTLVRNPGFTGAAVVTLAFGIGLAVAMFTVFDAVLARPLPVHDQARLIVLWGEADGSARKLPVAFEQFARFREAPRTMREVAGTLSARAWPQGVRDGDRTLSLNLAAVTGNFFQVLGSTPVLGRALRPDDDVVGAAPVMVISHGFWRRHFGGDPGAIGRRLTLHERALAYTVVGVAPPGLEYPAGADVWVPLIPFSKIEVVPIARLAQDATPAHAAEELRASFQRDASITWRDLRAAASPLPELVIGDVRPALILLSAAAALLLLIACINVANLLLVRASGRAHEIAVRRALGAGRGRILRQLLTESAVLALAGGLSGAALAVALVRGLLALAPPELPRLEEMRLTGVPLGLAAGVTIVALLIFGVLPALWSSGRGSLASPLRAGDRASTEPKARRRAQHALVIFQVGLAIVVLAAAGLLGRSLRQMERLDLGFAVDRLAIVQLAWPGAKYDGSDKLHALYDLLLPRIEALPDVASVALVSRAPFAGATGGTDGRFVSEGKSQADSAIFNMEAVGSGYFQTLDVPLQRGRPFTDADRDGSPRVVIITDAVARLFWPGEDAVGKRIGLGRPVKPEDWWTIVGIAADTRYRALREPAPTVYLPYRQFRGIRTLAIRTRGDAAAVVPSIRQAVREIDADVTVMEAATMAGLVAGQLAQPRLSAVLLGLFGAGALLLAAVGLYAMLAFVVRQRTRELAIRHALGASSSRLRLLVVRQALVLAGAGVLLGLAAALAGGRWLRSLLFDVSPADPLTLAGVAAMLLAVALAASYIPARRAMRADPVSVLRAD